MSGLQRLGEVGLEVAGGARAGAVVVEAPHAAVGQDAPPYPAVRLDVRRRQVAEYLAVRRPGAAPSVRVAGVEREAEALALLDDDGVPEPLLGAYPRGGALLGAGVGEQQQVGDVLVAGRALLRQVVVPSQQLQHRADELLLGDGLVGVGGAAECVVAPADVLPERGERLRLRRPSTPGCPGCPLSGSSWRIDGPARQHHMMRLG